MDGLAQHGRRSDRPMARLESGRSSDRSSQARALPTPGVDDASLTLGRRIGILVVLAALGGAIILAAGGAGGGGSQGGVVPPLPTPTPISVAATHGPVGVELPDPPTIAPSLVTPKRSLLTSRTIDLRIQVPDEGVSWDDLEVRAYRGTRRLASQPIARADLNEKGRVTLRDVPLRRGGNRLTVVLANPGGEGPRSNVVDLTVDDQAPRFVDLRPRGGTTLNANTITVKGTTEPALEVVVRNLTTGTREALTADAKGAFRTDVRLARGANTLSIATQDAAGNQRDERRVVVRGDGRASVALKLSRTTLPHRKLPRSITARATVLDADGKPVAGARVVFIAAPSGMQAFTHETTTNAQGVATWSGLRVTDQAFPGKGLVTVDVTLPSGGTLTRTAQLVIE